MFRLPLAAVAAALLLLAACDDAAAPAGTLGNVTVTMYVDADVSGTLTEGDLPLSGYDVQLEQDGAVVATATTGENGQATFQGVAPGGYQVELVDEPPQGSALTTSPSPTAVVNFQGSSPAVEFRFVWYPGVLSGWIYRNDGGTPAYEEDVDTPGSGVTVYLRERTAAGEPGDTLTWTTAAADGGYIFTGLTPGSYFVEFEQVGAMSYVEADRIFPVEVAPAEETEQSALFTGSIFMTVAEARAAAVDDAVAVIATITVPGGVFTSGSGGVNSEIWVQDETGGIAVFSVPTAEAANYPLGRVLEVVGTRAAFRGKEQIASPTIRSRGAGTIVAPVTVTGTQANARTNEGQLVEIENVEVVSLGSGTFSFDVITTAPDGQTVKIRIVSGTGFARDDFTVGSRYDITGILSEFDGVAQIQPRFDTDVVDLGAAPVPTARLIVNEFMPDPRFVADGSGEYIEIHNWGDAPADLQNYSIGDHSTTNPPHVITSSVVVPAGGYVVLALNGDAATNGGVTVDYVYSNIFLNNSSDGIILRDPQGATVDSVAYAGYTSGVAWGVVDPSADNTVVGTGSNWALQTTEFNSANGSTDRGTPRAQNDGYVAPAAPDRLPLPGGGGTLSPDPIAVRRSTSGSGATRR